MFLSRGDRDHGVAFQTHPVSQASARGEAKDSDILLGRDRYLLEPTEWPKKSQASCGFGEKFRDCSLGHAVKDGPHLEMTGASLGFSRAAAPVWGFSRGTTRSSGSLSFGAREVRFLCAWLGGARHCSRVMVGESTHRSRSGGEKGLK